MRPALMPRLLLASCLLLLPLLTSGCFGPVPLDCEPPTKAHRSRLSKLASGTAHSIRTLLEASIVIGEASNLPYLKGLAGIILLVSNSVQVSGL